MHDPEGNSEAQVIRNTTDKEAALLISEAEKQAEILKAEGEAEYMKNKWKHVMGTDPYYNRNLSLKNGYYKLP